MQKITLPLLLSMMAMPTYAQVETTTTETTIEGQDSSNDFNNRDVEKVEVTGSLIKRVDVEGPAAVQTFDKEYIEKTGWNNLGDMMRDLSANSQGVAADSAGNNSPASQTANLGGLGASRTLVLIDGRRAPRDGSLNGFDLSLIPIGAIERFDIMTDAGSALYGTDAIGGVINIITKKDFNGFDYSVSHFNSVDKGGDRTSSNFTYGGSNAKGNFTTSFTVRNNQKIKSRDRQVFNLADSFNAPAANYNIQDGTTGASGGFQNDNSACGDQVSAYVSASGACRYRFNDIKDETPQVKQVSNLTNFSYDLSSSTNIFGTVLASYKEADYVYAPGVVRMSFENADADLFGTGNNAGDTVNIFWRSSQLGNRLTNTQERAVGVNAGIRQYVGDTWEVSFIAGADNSKRRNENPLGYSNAEELKALMLSGQLNPVTNTGSIPDSVRETPFQEIGSEAAYAEVRATGELVNGWAGPIGMAVGAGYTYESIDIQIDQQSAVNNVTGGGAASAGKGNRRSQFAVAEILVPAAKGLEVQGAVRFDNFNTFGETINPKIGVAYRPVSQVLLRATAGTGFRAPDMPSLFSGSEGYPNINDFAAGSNQYRTLFAPNPDLQPETSRNVTIGAVIEPVQGLSFTVDYFDNKINDQIQTPALQRINNDERDFGSDFIERKYGVIANRGTDGGPEYTVKPINTYEVINRRLQFGVQAIQSIGNIGTVSLRNDTSYTFKWTEQFFEGDVAEDILTLPAAPKWRNTATLAYAPSRVLSFDARFITTGSSWKENPENGKFNMYTRIDLATNIGLFNNTATLRLGVQDLTGENPPFDPLANSATVSSLYDYTGTRFFATYRQTF